MNPRERILRCLLRSQREAQGASKVMRYTHFLSFLNGVTALSPFVNLLTSAYRPLPS